MTTVASAQPDDDRQTSLRRRTRWVVAGFALILVSVLSSLLRGPYVIYSPGPVVDVLGETDGKEIVQVKGRESFYDDGKLEMTTVYVTGPEQRASFLEVLFAWVSREQAVVPRHLIYPPDATEQDEEQQSSIEMTQSQDSAIAAALNALDIKYDKSFKVFSIAEGMPAEGKLKVDDVLRKINGEDITDNQQVIDAVTGTPAGEKVRLTIKRDDAVRTVVLSPKRDADGVPRIGIIPGVGFDFPFEVSVNVPEDIGGPSAGLMFSLSIYDTLTPGSLTDGETIAGTGTITPEGDVGPIGGIQQKIVAARDSGAELFFVPGKNCAEALGAPNGSMRLVRVDTMNEAVAALDNWRSQGEADLATCEGRNSASE